MSHICCETGEVITHLGAASGITRVDRHGTMIGLAAGTVILNTALLAIPRSLRRYGAPCVGELGVNVHRIVPEGDVAWLDDFIFSLREATVRAHLPHLFETLYGARVTAA